MCDCTWLRYNTWPCVTVGDWDMLPGHIWWQGLRYGTWPCVKVADWNTVPDGIVHCTIGDWSTVPDHVWLYLIEIQYLTMCDSGWLRYVTWPYLMAGIEIRYLTMCESSWLKYSAWWYCTLYNRWLKYSTWPCVTVPDWDTIPDHVWQWVIKICYLAVFDGWDWDTVPDHVWK